MYVCHIVLGDVSAGAAGCLLFGLLIESDMRHVKASGWLCLPAVCSWQNST